LVLAGIGHGPTHRPGERLHYGSIWCLVTAAQQPACPSVERSPWPVGTRRQDDAQAPRGTSFGVQAINQERSQPPSLSVRFDNQVMEDGLTHRKSSSCGSIRCDEARSVVQQPRTEELQRQSRPRQEAEETRAHKPTPVHAEQVGPMTAGIGYPDENANAIATCVLGHPSARRW
jgi:hypothetical protein